MIGKTISHYKILEKLGEGGMGVVYKAEDTKLDRFVALKFLPQNLNQTEEEKQRFIHEAKAASALDHNNICNIHEIDEAKDGQLFIAMALYEGQTLDQKIANGPLKLDQAVDIAVQISEGLAKAHSKEIVHRDLKPANIMLTEDGVVKILDFGLAKLRGQTKLTKEGTTLGTAAYMSPEQAQAQEVDQRTDIFSLGALVYEMLTGQQPFSGDYESAVLYSVLHEDPQPITALRTGVPMEMERTVFKCLEKAPDERYQSATELRVDLRKLAENLLKDLSHLKKKVHSNDHLSAESPRRPLRLKFWAFGMAGLLLALAAVYTYYWRETPESELPPMKISRITSLPGWENEPALSPDGSQIAFTWDQGNLNQDNIYVQFVGTNDRRQLTSGPDIDVYPVWSPDSRYIAFHRHAKDEREHGIYLVSTLGKTVQLIRTGDVAGLSWSPDGKYLAFRYSSSTDTTGVFLLTLDTREERRLTPRRAGTVAKESNIAFSPDSKTLAYVESISRVADDIYLIPTKGGVPTRLTHDNSVINGLTWTPNGQEIIFSSDRGGLSSLWRISLSGKEPKPIAAGGQNISNPTLSEEGKILAYLDNQSESNIYRAEIPSSSNQEITSSKFIASTAVDLGADLSPDASAIAFRSSRSGRSEIWLSDSKGENPYQLTNLKSNSDYPQWSPDGNYIAFTSRPEGRGEIYVVSKDGGLPRRLTQNGDNDLLPTWSRDGKWVYYSSNRGGERQIWRIPAEGGESEPVTQYAGVIAYESYDGKWLYYSESRASFIWRLPLTGGGRERVLNIKVANWREWTLTRNGIYYLDHTAGSPTALNFFSFARNEVKGIASWGSLVYATGTTTFQGMSMSPDERWFLYGLWENVEADIFMIENFR